MATGVKIIIIIILFASCKNRNNKTIHEEQYVHKVYPLLDTENSRWFFFTSASRPFGMVNLSPDTQVDGTWKSGYDYNTDTVKGFSHVHAWQLAGPSVMPVMPDSLNINRIFSDFYSGFSHTTEEIFPGYHKLYLDRYYVIAELTSTKRVGFHRYTFENNNKPAILFNLNGKLGTSLMDNGSLLQTGKYQVSGKVVNKPTIRRPKDCTVFFTAIFDTPVKSIQKDSCTGNYLIHLDVTENSQVQMKLAISYTSVQNAELNMKIELPDWNFNQIVKESKAEWNSLLSRIEVEGGSEKQQKRFYTDLWHSLQGRRIISDVNGAYPDNTSDEFRIGQLPVDENRKPLFNHYNSDSFWGAQWTINTLWGLVYPDIMEEFVYSLLQYYKDGGSIPRGPSGGNYTYVMTGASSTPFMISAIQKGIVKENIEEIYQALKKNHMPGGIMEKAGYEHNTNIGGGLKHYIEKGYVPYPIPEGNYGYHQDGASLTMEYAYQDWTLAQLAKKLGYTEDAEYFTQRSKNYVNVFNAESGWMHPKNIDGEWKPDFDPYQLEHGFNESNGAQSTWFVPQDLPGLAKLMGGDSLAVNKLEQSFEKAKSMGFTAGTSHDRETHPEYSRIPINYGNQPSIQTAYIFNYLNQPWRTQYWSREVTETAYYDLSTQKGYNGDEDQGLMGSLAVLMKLGLFSMKGGCSEDPVLELGSPIFDKYTIHLHKDYYPGEKLTVKTVNNSSENRFIQSGTLNDQPLNSWQIPQKKLTKGAVLILEMGNEPNKNWSAGL
jgi:predicted alpha-1,2-mannosidase